MSDLDLRELRREAAANPSDLARGRALAHALERTGERRGAFLEHCRLARLGDGAAQQRVLAWAPWSSEDGQGRARRARRAGIEGTPRVEWRAAGRDGVSLARDDDALVFAGSQGRPSVRGLDGELRWAYTGELPESIGRLELIGDDVLWLGRESLLLFDGVRGTILAEARLPMAWERCGIRGDRFVGVTYADVDPARPFAADLGRELGRLVWEGFQPELSEESGIAMPVAGPGAEPAEYTAIRVAGAWAWLGPLTCIRIETGVRHRPQVPDRVGHVPGVASLLAADEQGLIGGSQGLLEVDAFDGRVRWNQVGASWSARGFAAIGAETVVTLHGEQGALVLVGIDRTDGRERWRFEHPAGDPVYRDLVLAQDVAYVAIAQDDLTVVAHELATGKERFRVERPLKGVSPFLRLIPLERALVVEARGPSGEGIIGVLSEA